MGDAIEMNWSRHWLDTIVDCYIRSNGNEGNGVKDLSFGNK